MLKKFNIFSGSLLLVLSQIIYANSPTNLPILLDYNLSEHSGSTLVTSTNRVTLLLEDSIFGTTHGKRPAIKWGAIRSATLAGRYLFANYLATLQHEVFGHGARAREFNIGVDHFYVNFFTGSAYTAYTRNGSNKLQSNTHIDLTVTSAGSEATMILSHKLACDWLTAGSMDYRDSLLYFTSMIDQYEYIKSLSTRSTFSPSHDMNRYIFLLNQWYESTAISSHQLRNLNFFDLLNPIFYISIYNISKYLTTGELSSPFYMFELTRNLKFMPTFKLLLPFYGPEVMLLTYFQYKKSPFIVSVRYGNTLQTSSYGIGLEVPNIYQYKKLSIGGKINIWIQPSFQRLKRFSHNRFGLGVYMSNRLKLAKAFSLQSTIGFKSQGYVPGEPIKSTFILRLGAIIHL